MKILRFLLVVICAIILLRLAACTTGLLPLPTQEQPAQQNSSQHLVVEIDYLPEEQAREAALAYINSNFAEELISSIPDSDADWQVDNPNLDQRIGWESREYTLNGWTVSVSFPVVAPEVVEYRVVVDNPEQNFHWEGTLNADFQLIEK